MLIKITSIQHLFSTFIWGLFDVKLTSKIDV